MNNNKAIARQKWALDPPIDFATPYALGGYDAARLRTIPAKYLGRSRNLARAWTRICHHMPETIDASQHLDCLEFGTAHGAMLEIWQALGHRVVGTDFPWNPGKQGWAGQPWKRQTLEHAMETTHEGPIHPQIKGWVYQPIIESLKLDVRMVDGRKPPYPFEDKSFDIVCCYQAVDNFSEPEQWPALVAEFCRIARRMVVVGYNPLPLEKAADPARNEAARLSWQTLSNFSAHGMRTVFTEFNQTARGLYPATTKLLPID